MTRRCSSVWPVPNITTNIGSFLLFALLTITPFLSGCNRNEIERLKTERDTIQSKLTSLETDRDKLIQASNSLASAKEALSKEVQELSKANNAFQLERAGLLLTNGFFASEVERLRADLDAQRSRFLADQSRDNEAKRIAPIKDGLRALRKLDAAANIGTSLVDYNKLLIESQGPIREALDASDPETKKLIGKADKAFQDAKTLWNFCNNFIASMPRTSLEGLGDKAYLDKDDTEITQLILKYGIPNERSSSGYITIRRASALTMIWGIAKINLQQAENLFSAQAEKGAGSKAD